jgi:hypothetical protein|tara:strand:- start:31 stop:600 length:570 start_codon:yes stop_codon:yes gene_type:complete
MKLEVHYMRKEHTDSRIRVKDSPHDWLDGSDVAKYLETGKMDISSKVHEFYYHEDVLDGSKFKSKDKGFANDSDWKAWLEDVKEDLSSNKERFAEDSIWKLKRLFRLVSDRQMKDVSQKIFTYMNGMLGGPSSEIHPLGYGEENRKILNDLGIAHSSMSVCDHIVFPNGEIMVCHGNGWLKVKPKEESK